MKGKFFSSGGGMIMSGGGGDAMWGSITGTLSDQTDLQNALDGKSNVGHTHDHEDITDFDDAVEDVVSALDITSAVVGTMITHPVQPSPDWLECRGQPLSQAAYPALYNVLGNLFPEPTFLPVATSGTLQPAYPFMLPGKAGIVGDNNISTRLLYSPNIFTTNFAASNTTALPSMATPRAFARSEITGTIIGSCLNGSYPYIRSVDNGVTWIPPTTNANRAEGRQVFWVDNGTPFGRFISASASAPSVVPCAHFSDDDGDTWASGATIPGGTQYHKPLSSAIDPVSGEMVMVTEGNSVNARNAFWWRSNDLGDTWVYGGPITILPNRNAVYSVNFSDGFFTLTTRMVNGWTIGDALSGEDFFAPVKFLPLGGTAWETPLLPAAFQGEFANTTSVGAGVLPRWLEHKDRLYIIGQRGIMTMRGDGSETSITYNWATLTIPNWFISEGSINDDGYFLGINGSALQAGRLWVDYPQAGAGKFYIPNETQAYARRWIKAT